MNYVISKLPIHLQKSVSKGEQPQLEMEELL